MSIFVKNQSSRYAESENMCIFYYDINRVKEDIFIAQQEL